MLPTSLIKLDPMTVTVDVLESAPGADDRQRVLNIATKQSSYEPYVAALGIAGVALAWRGTSQTALSAKSMAVSTQ